jgi:hypothetical protein
MSTPVTLERYAEIRAEMDAGKLRDEVLGRAGITTDEWSATQRSWLERMGTELERGRFELTNRYTQAFLERQRALQATASPAPAAVAPAAVAPAAVAPAAVAPTVVAPTAVAAPVSSPTTAPLPQVVVPAPLPFAPAPPAPIAPAPMAPMPREAPLQATAEMADDAARTLSTPFGAAGREALPFTQSPFDAEEPNLRDVPADFDTRTTLPLVRGRLVEKAVLPFKDASSDTRATLRSEPEDLALDQDQEAPSTAQAPLAGAGPALPFVTLTEARREASTAPSPPEMKHLQGITLSQYAQICADVRASPDSIAQIRSHYRLDAHAWVALHTLWQERFQSDPALRTRWQALVETALGHRR